MTNKGFWGSLGKMLSKVPAEIAGPVAITMLVVFTISNILPQLKNDLHITMVLIILLIFGLGCTYCIVSYARSKGEEKHYANVWKNLEGFRRNTRERTVKISQEVEKAVSSMGGGEDEQ